MKLEELRKKNDMTQSDLAAMVGVQQKTVSQWESGKRSPTIQMLMSLSKIFRCTIDELYGGEEEIPPEHNKPQTEGAGQCISGERSENVQAVIASGSPEEIAALVLAVQERQRQKFVPSDSFGEADDTTQKCCC